ncbi:proteasome activator subunit 4 isoform X2 [Cryptomeria japonica]|uniref:proteasome activator subunit 4 isoform X2 n=1 Tax=Cryptomeria japonica TaxID=3369 RepID=UPI0027DA7A14|nr:proteasome activator subunit 4 isoform X2 [Cryptomeria japonica]
MHLYNAWLPPPVAELAVKEKQAFTEVVNTIKSTWHPEDPASAFATLKWIPIVQNFLKAKSEIALEDVKVLIETGLELFFQSQHNLIVQVRWGNLLARLLKKHGKKLDLKILWRPFYNLLVQRHFTRCQSAEGLSLKRNHLDALKSLIHYSRKFFPSGSAEEIWLEFRSLMDNLWHNSSLEGVGFLQLFLPTNPVNCGFYNSNWIKDVLDLWAGMPKCQFWDFQWGSIMCRVIKNCPTIDWECFLPVLFTQYLNIFEVPVANNNGSYPFSRADVPGSTISVFCSRKLGTITREIAKSIVFLLKPGGSAQVYFENMVSLLEQYYHPSNGGWWTYSLERFLRYLVYYFQKRLSQEERNAEVESRVDHNILGKLERAAFVRVVLKLIERGQYSKSDTLAETAVYAASVLSYVEPSLVLPFVVSRFHIALDTMTAPHQFKSAIAAVALAGRALLLSSSEASENVSLPTDYKHALMVSMYNTLLGMDVNDPPKTLATMQLYGSIFSSIAKIDDKEDGSMMMMLDINFSEWLDEFLSRLFSLLLHLEPNSQSNEGLFLAPASGTFLVEDGSFYFCLLEILLGKLTSPLYNQALKRISKFVHDHILPGAAAEVGLLCSATLYPNPAEAVVQLIKPMIHSVLSSLKDSPSTGISSNQTLSASSAEKVSLSPGLEASVAYCLNVLSVAINFGGPHLLQIREELKDAISAAFDAPSWKVNEAGNHLLRSLIGSLVLYYPLDQYKCILSHPHIKGLEEWISKKENNTEEVLAGPKWHIPNNDEIAYTNELLNLHLISALVKLKQICQIENQQESGYDKQHLRVILLQIDASLQGVRSCLPDFNPMPRDGKHENEKHNTAFIWGAAGVSIGTVELRQETAETIDITCKYILTHSADNSMLLELLVDILDALANYGSLEYAEWSNNYRAHIHAGRLDPAAINEPSINYITGFHTQGKRRPRWALIDKADMHNTWRASQSGYHKYRLDDSISLPEHVILLTNDLLDLTMKEYDGVRQMAGKSLIKLLKRFPSLIKYCMPKLTASLENSGTPEHAALGACAILQSRTVMRHIMKDWSAFSSFVLALLGSSHHESLKAQKAISELFIGFNLQYTGLPRIKSQSSAESSEKSAYMSVITQIRSLSSDIQIVHWRYNLMAHRILLLMVLPSYDNFDFSSKAREEVACHFAVHLKSHLPPVRFLAAASLVLLLQASPYKKSINDNLQSSCLNVAIESSLEDALNPILTGEGFFKDMLNGLSFDHFFADSNNTSGGGNRITQSIRDKSINGWFQAFYDPWPRSRNWNSLLWGGAFLPSFAKLFKRLVQECGETVLQALQNPLEELLIATEERDKQCLASEVLAGLLHSDVSLVLEAWESWLCTAVHKVVRQPTVETNTEWATCIRFAVTGKGRDGKAIPLMRQKILECLAEPLSTTVATHMVAKRFTLLSAALIETYPSCMPPTEITLQENLLEEVLNCMGHSAAQVRESIGTLLSILCSNLRLDSAFAEQPSSLMERLNWSAFLVERAGLYATKIHNASKSNVLDEQLSSSDDKNYKGDTEEQEHIKWMETVFYFVISALKSGRASVLTDIIVGLLYPVISLQVREQTATVLSGLMRGRNDKLVKAFRENSLKEALLLQKGSKTRISKAGSSLACKHGMVLALSSLVLSVPYDMPSWLPGTITILAHFNGEPSPVRSTVMKTIAEFRRTHADTWALQKDSFTEEQLEVLADSSSSLSYFA